MRLVGDEGPRHLRNGGDGAQRISDKTFIEIGGFGTAQVRDKTGFHVARDGRLYEDDDGSFISSRDLRDHTGSAFNSVSSTLLGEKIVTKIIYSSIG